MNVNLVPFAVVWALLATVVLILIVYRLLVSRREDDTLQLIHATGPAQQAIAHKLETIDRWGKILTAVTILYGVAIGAAYLYQMFVRTSTQY
ncbi:MAG TPA: hypothetical protein VN442_15240 [Bryobacteraceae bacterium]|nr:hypothetical protein [Bryobacteraceae bacterium]